MFNSRVRIPISSLESTSISFVKSPAPNALANSTTLESFLAIDKDINKPNITAKTNPTPVITKAVIFERLKILRFSLFALSDSFSFISIICSNSFCISDLVLLISVTALAASPYSSRFTYSIAFITPSS
ncbi:hypothetical protein D3C73_1314750 [compost metagenome]